MIYRESITIQPWSRQWLGCEQATSHCLSQGRHNSFHAYASLGFNESNTSDSQCSAAKIKYTARARWQWNNALWPHKTLGETARWLQLQPSSSWPQRRKRSKMLSLCTTRITRTILLGCIWILDFHFKIVLVHRRRYHGYLIPTRCNNGKSDLDNGCTILVFSTDDGCTRWWRWSYQFRWVFFYKHTGDPLQTNMHVDCMIVVKCDTCKIFGAYRQFACIATSIVGNVGTCTRRSMQVTHSQTCISIISSPTQN